MGHAVPSLAAILCGSFIVSTDLQAPWGTIVVGPQGGGCLFPTHYLAQ